MKMQFNEVKVVDKPWGRELWLAVEDEYAGKILEVNKGSRLSHQYHERKKESMYVLDGRMKITVNDVDHVLKQGDSITLKPGDRHRIEALEDLRIIEVSTPELDDVVRLEDDYSRR